MHPGNISLRWTAVKPREAPPPISRLAIRAALRIHLICSVDLFKPGSWRFAEGAFFGAAGDHNFAKVVAKVLF